MADSVPITAGVGTSIATDDIGGVHYQIIKLAWGPLDTANILDDAAGKRLPVAIGEALPAGTNNIGDVDVLSLPALPAGTNNIGDVDVLTLPALAAGTNEVGAVVARRDLQRISTQSAGLTTAATAYTAGDQVGTIFTVADAARASDGSGTITGIVLIDSNDIIGTYDVVFFTQSVTLAADNAAFAISDADSAHIVGLAQLTGAFDITNNRVAQLFNLAIPYKCVGSTSLFAALITRAGHTFFTAVTDLRLIVLVERN